MSVKLNTTVDYLLHLKQLIQVLVVVLVVVRLRSRAGRRWLRAAAEALRAAQACARRSRGASARKPSSSTRIAPPDALQLWPQRAIKGMCES